MGVLDYINKLNYNAISKKIFRHEVEAAIYGNKKFPLPKIPRVTGETLQKYKSEYPFNFYNDKASREAAADELRTSENADAVLSDAKKILENRYNLLNNGELFLGDKINWHYDYHAKYKWHEVLVWRDDFFRFPAGADIKYPWELARFYQAITLGKAWLLTSDDIYIEKFLSLFADFNNDNPFCIGVNWVSTDEAAIRLLNVFFGFALIMPSELVDEQIINSLHEFILQHAIFIENNLSNYKVRGHEYLSNLLGLAVTGLLFKHHAYGRKNLQFAYSGFEQQMRAQVYRDGVNFEQSIPFHSFILEHFYLAKIVLEKAGCVFTDEYNSRLHKMFLAQNVYLREDNSIPQIGDAISGRAAGFTNDIQKLDFGYPLAVGKYLFKDPSLKSSPCGSSELIFLFGPGAVREFKQIGDEQDIYNSVSFPTGGHYILRNKDVHLFVEAGEIGKKGEGAPGHNDTFTFELYYKQKSFIVDPGTYSYYANPELRNFLRSVKAHNTNYVDHEQLAEFDGLFGIKSDLTKPKTLQWITNNHEDILAVQHYAYTRFQDPVICKRTFHFNKEKYTINIKDELLGGMKHEVISNINFHPGVKLKNLSAIDFQAIHEEVEMEIKITSSSKLFAANIFEAQYSPAYGVLNKTNKLNIILNDNFPAIINTEIILK